MDGCNNRIRLMGLLRIEPPQGGSIYSARSRIPSLGQFIASSSQFANQRTSPLMYHEDGDAVVVVASKAGQPTNPAWFHNLKANPDTTIQIGSEIRPSPVSVAPR